MQMEMRRLNAELEKNRAIGAGDIEQGALDDFLYARELLRLGIGQVCEVFDVPRRDEHGLAADGRIAVQQKHPIAEVEDQFSG